MNIYSPKNIARSHMRAAQIRAQVASGELPDPDGSWLDAADEIEKGATERERVASNDLQRA